MSEALKMNNTMTVLDLDSGKNHKQKMIEKRDTNSSPCACCETDNGIGNDGAMALSEMLMVNTKLRDLRLNSMPK